MENYIKVLFILSEWWHIPFIIAYLAVQVAGFYYLIEFVKDGTNKIIDIKLNLNEPTR